MEHLDGQCLDSEAQQSQDPVPIWMEDFHEISKYQLELSQLN